MKKRLSDIKNIRTTNLRLNMDIPIQQKAWAYLQGMDKKLFKSYSNVIAYAVVEYFDHYNKVKVGEQDITEKELFFIQQIQAIINKEIMEAIELNCNKIVTASNNIFNKEYQESIYNQTEQIHIEEINNTVLDFVASFSGDE